MKFDTFYKIVEKAIEEGKEVEIFTVETKTWSYKYDKGEVEIIQEEPSEMYKTIIDNPKILRVIF